MGKKGVIIFPKTIHESAGLKEGDALIVELSDGINLRPERKVDFKRMRAAFEEHNERLMKLNTKEPEPGELVKIYLEEEFEECGHS